MQKYNQYLSTPEKDVYFSRVRGRNVPSPKVMAYCAKYAYSPMNVGKTFLNEEENGEKHLFRIKSYHLYNDVTIMSAYSENSSPQRVILSFTCTKTSLEKEINLMTIHWRDILESSVIGFFTEIRENLLADYYVCGHYLGGIIAQYLARELRLGGATFFSVGIKDPQLIMVIPMEQPNYYDEDHPKLYNHVVINTEDKKYFLKQQEPVVTFFGNVILHWPFTERYLREGSGMNQTIGTKMSYDYFFKMENFCDWHFSGKDPKFGNEASRNKERASHECTHSFCFFSSREKEQEEYWEKNGTAITTFGIIFTTLVSFGPIIIDYLYRY